MQRPSTRFAWNGDVSLACQVCGDGPTDLLYLQGYCSNVDVNWDGARLARLLSGLAAHARLVITDRRGWGCSERFSPGDVPNVDTLTDDVFAVMKAAGSDRASILATYECAIVALLFAATYPERTRAVDITEEVSHVSLRCDRPAFADIRRPAPAAERRRVRRRPPSP